MKVKGLFILLLVSAALWGQNAQEEILKASKQLFDADRVKIDISYTVYARGNDPDALLSKKMNVAKSGLAFRYEMEEALMIYNTSQTVFVNQPGKQIIYSKTNPKDQKKYLGKLETINPEEMMKRSKSIEFVGESGGFRIFRVPTPEKMIEDTEIWLRSGTSELYKLVYHYNPSLAPSQGHAEVVFESVDKNPAFPKNYFNLESLTRKDGKELVGTGDYANYHVQEVDASQIIKK